LKKLRTKLRAELGSEVGRKGNSMKGISRASNMCQPGAEGRKDGAREAYLCF
jgi:hypothetical protein